MKKSNLFLILSKLNKKELRELRKWLHSPAHNQRPDVILLFDYMLENAKPQKTDNLTKELAFPFVYPNEKTFDDGKMRQSIHFLHRAIEDFLVFQELQEDEVKAKITFARVLSRKGLTKGFQKTIQSAYGTAQKNAIRNMSYHQNDYEIRQVETSYAGLYGRVKGFDFQGLSDSLDHMYISTKLSDACTMLSHQAVTKTEYDTGLLDLILKHISLNPSLLDIPAIGIYYYGLNCTKDNSDEASFQKFKEKIFKNSELFPLFEIKHLYIMAINFCLRRANSGDESYLRESFELYKTGIDKNALLENGYISRFTFLNVVSNAARLNELQWLEEFIQKKGDMVQPENRENILHYCISKLEYEKGNYKKAMQLLSQIEYDDILMNLSGKIMLLKMFYEDGNINSLESLISSSNTYILRKKIIGYHRNNYKNIIGLTRKMAKVNPYSKKDVEKLKLEIKATNPLTEKSWLLDQIEKL